MPSKLELRPSGAHRWLICHGQPAAVQGLLETRNQYTDRGTAAHLLLELALRLELNEEQLQRYEGYVLRGGADTPPNLPPIDATMLRGVYHTLDYLRSYRTRYPETQYHTEHTLPIKLGKHRMQGTPDLVLDRLPHELTVLDYKHGVVYVDHEENPQLLLYALGHVQQHEQRVADHTRLRLVIVQPNARAGEGPIRETELPLAALRVFAKTAEAAATAAHAPHPPRVAGAHCRFCRAAGNCAVYADYVLRQAGIDFAGLSAEAELPEPADLTADQITHVLQATEALRAWLLSVEGRAIERLLAGESVPGYKVVASITHRKWRDAAQVSKALQRLKLDPDLVMPRVPLSPAQLEKLTQGRQRKLNPATLQQLQPYIMRNPPEPRVVPLADSRPFYVPGQEFDDVD